MPSAATPAIASPAPAAAASRKPRTDGVEARARLLHTALKLFAQKGFAKTSTREIAQAAGTNLAAIAYYFGDKTGLYSACFSEPFGNPGDIMDRLAKPGLALREALAFFFTAYLEPLKHDDLAQDCLRLHLREMLEPTSQRAVELERDIRQPHMALVGVLCRHLGLARADDDVHRLAFYIGGYAALLGRLDTITFTAGVGENSPEVRSEVCARLKVFGVELDEEANKVRSKQPRTISTPDSKVQVLVVPTNEELAMARQSVELLSDN